MAEKELVFFLAIPAATFSHLFVLKRGQGLGQGVHQACSGSRRYNTTILGRCKLLWTWQCKTTTLSNLRKSKKLMVYFNFLC